MYATQERWTTLACRESTRRALKILSAQTGTMIRDIVEEAIARELHRRSAAPGSLEPELAALRAEVEASPHPEVKRIGEALLARYGAKVDHA